MTLNMDTWIASRYPSAFPGGAVAPECGSGWTALIEAVAIVVAGRGNATSAQIPIIGIKEKYGSVRISYGGADAWIDGAIDFLEAMSVRVCEDTGMYGCLMSRGGWWRTVSPAIAVSKGFTPPQQDGHPQRLDDIRLPSLTEVVDTERRGALMSRCRRVLVPPGWAALVDVLITVLDRVEDTDLRIDEIHHLDGLLHVVAHGRDAEASGAIAAAVALSRRVDPTTGYVAPEWTR